MTSKILLKGGCVLTLGAGTKNHARADVLIEDTVISEIGPDLRARGADTIDVADTIVMPGFVDTHRHGWRSLFRNSGGQGSQGGRSDSVLYGPDYTPDDVYAGTVISLLGAVESGITTVVDWVDVGTTDEHTAAAIQAHKDAGIRTVLVHCVPGLASAGHGSGRTLESTRAGCADLPLTEVAVGLDYPGPSGAESAMATWKEGIEAGLRVHVHVGTTPGDRGSLRRLADSGLLGSGSTLVHCSNLGEDDLDVIASSGSRVSLSPASEMAGGLGTPPIQLLLDRGIRPGLGVDDERIAPGDIFAQMRATNSIQHATMFDLKLAGKSGLPTLLTTREVIRFATIDGAVAAGTSGRSGSIEVGKQADIIVLRADRPNIAPINDPIGAVVWGMDTSNVDYVFVAGQALMSGGILAADVGRARDLARVSNRRLVGAATGDVES